MRNKNELLKLTGYIILAISCILFILIPVIPFLDISASDKALFSGILFVAAEVLFYLSLVFLGKGFYEKIRNKLASWRNRKKITEIVLDENKKRDS